MKKEHFEPVVECGLAADLPLQPDELQLLQDLLSELLTEMNQFQAQESGNPRVTSANTVPMD